jgi:hypothetical protein
MSRYCGPLKEVQRMFRWNPRIVRVAIVLGAFASLAIASGAGARWS